MRITKSLPSTRTSYILSIISSLIFLGFISLFIFYQDGDELDFVKILFGLSFLTVTPVLLSLILLGIGKVIDKKITLSNCLRYASMTQPVLLLGLLFLFGIENSDYVFTSKEIKEILNNTEVWKSPTDRCGYGPETSVTDRPET